MPPSQQRRAAELLQAIGGAPAAGQLMSGCRAGDACSPAARPRCSPAAARALGWARPPPPPLPGERKSVLLIEDQLSADPRLADAQRHPAAGGTRNSAWPQAGGGPTHAMQHLAAADAIDGRLAHSASVPARAAARGCWPGRWWPAAGCSRSTPTAGPRPWTPRRAARSGGSSPRTSRSVDRLPGGAAAYADGTAVRRRRQRHGLRAGRGRRGRGLAAARSRRRSARRRPWPRAGCWCRPPTASSSPWMPATRRGRLAACRPVRAGRAPGRRLAGGRRRASWSPPTPRARWWRCRSTSGQQLWSDTVLRPRRTLAIGAIADIVGDPVIAGDRVFVAGASGEMAAFDLERGAREWTADVTSTQTPWVAGNFIFVLTERNEVVCLVDQGGRIRWVSPLADAGRSGEPGFAARSAGPARSWSATACCSRARRARSSASRPSPARSWAPARSAARVSVPPAVADGTVFFLTDDAELVAFR